MTSFPETARRSGGEVRAHRESVVESFDSVVKYLSELLSTKLVAYIADVNPTTVSRWADGETSPSTQVEKRIRATHHIARLLLQHDANHTVRAWFIGMNPQLDDEAPADALKSDQLRETLVAARAFLDGA